VVSRLSAVCGMTMTSSRGTRCDFYYIWHGGHNVARRRFATLKPLASKHDGEIRHSTVTRSCHRLETVFQRRQSRESLSARGRKVSARRRSAAVQFGSRLWAHFTVTGWDSCLIGRILGGWQTGLRGLLTTTVLSNRQWRTKLAIPSARGQPTIGCGRRRAAVALGWKLKLMLLKGTTSDHSPASTRQAPAGDFTCCESSAWRRRFTARGTKRQSSDSAVGGRLHMAGLRPPTPAADRRRSGALSSG